MKSKRKKLDPSQRSSESIDLEYGLRNRVVGQDEAIEAIVDLYQVFRAGLNPAKRPVGNFLFLGPTGSGKTRTVEAVAETLFNNSSAMSKVNCAEFQHSHEIAKLIGSPPGYLGHRETNPFITQDKLTQYQTEKLKLSFLLFDEIEKASSALWQLLLGILDKATLTLGDNRVVDLSSTMIFMTSNLGGSEITSMMAGTGIGFDPAVDSKSRIDHRVEKVAADKAKKNFAPEFMNRIDKVVVFRSLGNEELDRILDLELRMVQERIAVGLPGFVFKVNTKARDFLLREGTDIKYGARHLKRIIERELVYPLASLISTGQLISGDVLYVDFNTTRSKLSFDKESAGILLPVKLTEVAVGTVA